MGQCSCYDDSFALTAIRLKENEWRGKVQKKSRVGAVGSMSEPWHRRPLAEPKLI